MGKNSGHDHPASRTAAGEIVAVQGGYVLRSMGRKDRHSKVCTARGPRDRRVRLAGHTAIQFFDLQDRLGYDRPSKAMDWLIKKAKAAIDELAQLPAWRPTTCSAPNESLQPGDAQGKLDQQQQQQQREHGILQAGLVISNVSGHSSERATTVLADEDDRQALHQSGIGSNSSAQNASFLPPSLDSDDVIKSFFPMGASAVQFQSFPTPDLPSRCVNHNHQDLRLSLQSIQDPILLHHGEQAPPQGQVSLNGIPLGFNGTAGWPEHYQQAVRFSSWNVGGDIASGSGEAAASAGHLVNPPPAPQQLSGPYQHFSQRGPLQSSNTPAVRARIDPSISVAGLSQNQPQTHHPGVVPVYPPSVSGTGFPSGFGAFPGFHVPVRIQGDEKEQDGYAHKPSSASADSRY